MDYLHNEKQLDWLSTISNKKACLQNIMDNYGEDNKIINLFNYYRRIIERNLDRYRIHNGIYTVLDTNSLLESERYINIRILWPASIQCKTVYMLVANESGQTMEIDLKRLKLTDEETNSI